MKVTRYVNAFVQNTPIKLGDDQDQFGTLLSEYDVTEYWDLRSSTSSSTPRRAYIVNLRQRLTLANKNAAAITEGPNKKQGHFAYPALAVNGVKPTPWRKDVQFYLEDYSPKTLNASVTTSNNQGTDSQKSGSVQHTAGSSTSVTNSYETSVSAGFSGESLTGSVTSGFSHATTNTTEQSTSRETSNSQGQQAGTSSSMSVKDWSSYAFIDAGKQQASWAWGQEYPWNVIDFRDSDGDSSVKLPLYVQKLLYDGTFVYPPSQISQFGLNFVSHATWVFFSDTTAGPDDERVDFEHTLSYWQASHSVDEHKQLSAVMAQVVTPNHTVETVTLNLPLLALEPVTSPGPENGAVVGFVSSEFIALPGQDGPFRLKSHANNVYVSNGTGFGGPADDDAVLSARGVTAASPAHLTVQFKIVDPDIELALHLKHWKLSAEGCRLTVTVNGQSIMRHVDAKNAAAGGDNITTIALRSRDYTSADYYDYLVMGTNTIDITIAPADHADSCDYALRALAVQ